MRNQPYITTKTVKNWNNRFRSPYLPAPRTVLKMFLEPFFIYLTFSSQKWKHQFSLIIKIANWSINNILQTTVSKDFLHSTKSKSPHTFYKPRRSFYKPRRNLYKPRRGLYKRRRNLQNTSNQEDFIHSGFLIFSYFFRFIVLSLPTNWKNETLCLLSSESCLPVSVPVTYHATGIFPVSPT